MTDWLTVAPLVGAWIEIDVAGVAFGNQSVAPLVGAWIEICAFFNKFLPHVVAPLVGAWIEISLYISPSSSVGRSPCGSVD